MNQIVFQDGASDSLRDELLASATESAAMLLAVPSRTPMGRWRLLVREVIRIPPGSYLHQTPAGVSIAPEFTAFVLKKARASGSCIVFVHTHPWHGRVRASSVDRECEAVLMPCAFSRVPGVPHARLILGREAYDAALFDNSLEELPLEVVDVGAVLLRPARSPEDVQSNPHFDRQIRAFGALGQRRVESLRVAIIGLGGTGSVVAQQLAYLGAQRFLLIDPEDVEESNLNRVVGATRGDVGRSKVDVAEGWIKHIRPDADVEVIKDTALKVAVARSILDTDAFFCCTDTHGSRAVLNQLAYQYLVPGFDVGVVIQVLDERITHITGRVQMLAPGLACLVCSEVLDPEQVRRDLMTEEQRRADPYIVGAAQPQPAVISINSTVVSLAVTMYLAAVAGVPVGTRHQIVRFESGMVRAIANEQTPQCVVCSTAGAIACGDRWSLPGAPDGSS